MASLPNDNLIATTYNIMHICRPVLSVASIRVCLSVYPLKYLESYAAATSPHFAVLSQLASGRGSVLLGRRCDTLCISGFVDAVMFHIMDPVARHMYAYKSTTVSSKPNATIEH